MIGDVVTCVWSHTNCVQIVGLIELPHFDLLIWLVFRRRLDKTYKKETSTSLRCALHRLRLQPHLMCPYLDYHFAALSTCIHLIFSTYEESELFIIIRSDLISLLHLAFTRNRFGQFFFVLFYLGPSYAIVRAFQPFERTINQYKVVLIHFFKFNYKQQKGVIKSLHAILFQMFYFFSKWLEFVFVRIEFTCDS